MCDHWTVFYIFQHRRCNRSHDHDSLWGCQHSMHPIKAHMIILVPTPRPTVVYFFMPVYFSARRTQNVGYFVGVLFQAWMMRWCTKMDKYEVCTPSKGVFPWKQRHLQRRGRSLAKIWRGHHKMQQRQRKTTQKIKHKVSKQKHSITKNKTIATKNRALKE